MKPLLLCFVCGSPEVVVLEPLPLCAYHENPPEIPVGMLDSDEAIEMVENWDEVGYNYSTLYGDFPVPVYPI